MKPATQPFERRAERLPRAVNVRVGLPGWRVVLSVLASLLVGVLAWLNRAWLLEALSLARSARLDLLAAALGTILLSYLVSSRVFGVALRELGYRIGLVRLWATAVTAIVISQCIPAGGIGSYAFLIATFRRRGLPAGHAALLAALEALSYAAAMLLIGAFSVAYLLAHAAGAGAALAAPLTAGVVALATCGAAVWLLRLPDRKLRRALMRLSMLLPKRRRGAAARSLYRSADELLRARELLATRPRLVGKLVAMQLLALCGHGLALLLLVWSLGGQSSYGAALAAFGVALITSTFNLLPGGGGTVETAVVATLLQLGAGSAAVPAAILFRLLNFWALLPVCLLLLSNRAKC